MRVLASVLLGVAVLCGCSIVKERDTKTSLCLVSFDELEEIKGQIENTQINDERVTRSTDALFFKGNVIEGDFGRFIGFYGDWTLYYYVLFDQACKLDSKLETFYKTDSVNSMTFVFSSWKDEKIEVYPNTTSPPENYNILPNYSLNKPNH